MSGRKKELELKKQIKENRKNAIMNAAEELFLSKNYEATKMQEIADKAGYSKGTVYNHFKSKEELYLAMGIKAYDFMLQAAIEYTEKEDPGMKQLMAIGYAYYAFSKEYPNYAMIFHDIGVKFPEIFSKPKDQLSRIEMKYIEQSYKYRDIVVRILGDAVKIKAIRYDKSPFLIGYILSTITNAIVKELLESPKILKQFKLKADDVIDFVFEILADGLKPRE